MWLSQWGKAPTLVRLFLCTAIKRTRKSGAAATPRVQNEHNKRILPSVIEFNSTVVPAFASKLAVSQFEATG